MIYECLTLENLHTKHNMKYSFLSFCWLLTIFTTQAQQTLVVSTNDNTGRFKTGKWMSFDVLSSSSGVATYEIKYDKFTPVIKTDTLQLKAGVKRSVLFVHQEPGSVIFKVTKDGVSDYAGATFAPFDIEVKEEAPEDFDDFWQEAKKELATVPLAAKLSEYSSSTYSTTYRINLGMVDQRKVYGFISIPKMAGSYSAVLTLPSFGSTEDVVKPTELIAEQVGVIAMTISIHNTEPDQRDPKAYQPDDFTDPYHNYYRYAVLAALRSIDYLFSRTDFNGELAVTGVSQGGGLAIMAAGLDERVDLLVVSNPTHCNHTGIKYGVASGFPYYLSKVQQSNDYDKISEAVKYYDAVYFARRYKGPVLAFVSYEDQVTPTSGTFAAFNDFSGQKIIMHGTTLAHAHSEEYWIGRYDAFRRFLPSIQGAPWPYAREDKGYWIEAGRNKIATVNQDVMLQGLGLNHLDTLNTYANWEKVEGRGNVVFSNPNVSYTSARFSLPGKYILRYSVEDRTLLATKGKYYTLMDEVEVVVEDVITEPIDLICKKDTVIYTTADFALVNWKLPRINSPACSEGIFNIEQVEGPENGSMLQAGEWRITYRVYDDCQREGRCSFVVKIVKEVREFEVKCPQDIRLTLPVGQFSVRVNWDLPKVFSVCESGFRIKRIKGLPSGSVFGLGISEIVYEITDECGHREICTFYVVITFPVPNQEDRFVGNQNLEYNILVTPNPTQSDFWVETIVPATGKVTLHLIDQLGRVQYEQQELLEAGATRIACSIGQLPKGWYMLQISQNNIILGRSALLMQ